MLPTRFHFSVSPATVRVGRSVTLAARARAAWAARAVVRLVVAEAAVGMPAARAAVNSMGRPARHRRVAKNDILLLWELGGLEEPPGFADPPRDGGAVVWSWGTDQQGGS